MMSLTANLPLLTSNVWNSPDETAQAFFIKLFAEHGSLAYPEPLNFVMNNLIHPRSTVVVDGFIVPGGFVGLPLLYGSLAKVFGGVVLWIATPILTALALWAFYQIVLMVWDKKIAMIATVAFAAHPAVIYYTARGLFPNMVFVDLVILGAMFLITRPLRASDLVGAACLGMALMVRFSEIIWIAPVWVALALWGWKTVSWRRAATWIAVIAVFLGMLGVVNNSLYGKPWSFGYTVNGTKESTSWILEDAIEESSLRRSSGPSAFVFPFGLHPLRAARIAGTYAFRLFPFWALLAVLGCMLWFRGPRPREQKIWVLATAAVGLFLMLYYGSWLFSDHPNPRAVTIGTSYMRYWLPVFALLAPFLAQGIAAISRSAGVYLPQRRSGGQAPALRILVMGIIVIFGLQVAVFAPEEGLIAVRENLRLHAAIREQVFAVVPDHGIIITDRHDKFFFPVRKVVVGLRDPKTLDGLPALVQRASVYYYGLTLNPRALHETNALLKDYGVVMRAEKYFGPEALYAVSKL